MRLEQLMERVDTGDDCWVWQSTRDTKGYGRFYEHGSTHSAHRAIWEHTRGPIPEGMYLDHLCFNKSCVRPDHLRPVTAKQNAEHRQGAQANNQGSKVRGVYKAGKSWKVLIRHNQKLLHFGCYPTIEEASVVAERERASLFTHADEAVAA